MRFFFHYNKPASKKEGKPIISLHCRRKCFLIENLVCEVSTWGMIRQRQPYFVMVGDASTITVTQKKIAYIK